MHIYSRPSPYAGLTSFERLGECEVEGDGVIKRSGGDVKHCFYWCRIAHYLAAFFGLGDIVKGPR